MADFQKDLLVEPEWLIEHKEDSDLVIVDCPWEYYSYTRAHIPGALCRPGHPYVKAVDKDGNLSLFLPGPQAVKELSAELGIGPDSTVVMYDEWGSIFAARLWWVLGFYGHQNVKLLNGGWQGWVAAELPISFTTSHPTAPAREFRPTPHPERLATLEQLLEKYNDPEWQVLDARSDDEHCGRITEENERSGHIPGARNLEWNLLLENSADEEAVRRFRTQEEMQDLIERAGASRERTTVTHCQAAIRGSFMAFSLELLGYPTPRLYDGSMAEWANLEHTPLD